VNEIIALLGIDFPVSAFQVRIGGCKGVLSLDPSLKGRRIVLRPSMQKFDSTHTELEIVKPAIFNSVYLNRQVITLLSSLGVSDCVFKELHDNMLTELDQMLTDPKVATKIVKQSPGPMTKCLITMLDAGIEMTEDMLLGSLLTIRKKKLADLQKKTRIFIEQGASLMGVTDESKTLEYGQVYIQVVKDGVATVIEGDVTVTKNPCVHPGDVRVLRAVKPKTDLSHHVNVIVFPQKGHRPHTNETSGSDLDGDEYFITWNSDLKPPKIWYPTEYPTLKQEPSNTSKAAMIDFIVEFITSGMIQSSLLTV
jgi:RNA-dependent RNA polymerase